MDEFLAVLIVIVFAFYCGWRAHEEEDKRR